MNTNIICKTSNGGIVYTVTKGNDTYRPYGVAAYMQEDGADRKEVCNLYFSETEAELCCKWLCDNEVYPVTLCEVLENLYAF